MKLPNEELIDRASISEQVFEYVKKVILSGGLSAGERVYENVIAADLNVSRTPVREAIRKLAEYGLVLITPRRSVIVASITPKDAHDISIVRLSLEKLAFQLFEKNVTHDQLVALREIALRCRKENDRGDIAAAHELDSDFHLAIAEASGNAELSRLLRILDARLQLVRLRQHLSRTQLSEYFEQHEVLVDLVEQKAGVKVSKLLEKHILHDLQ